MFRRVNLLHLSASIITIGMVIVLAVIAPMPRAISSPMLQDDTAGQLDTAGAISPLLSYQGRLLDQTTGAPKSGTFTFTFRLYAAANGGSALWTETKDLQVGNGLFTTLLGDTNTLPGELFNGQKLWLGVKIGSDAEATPRQALGNVAYALYTNNAAQLAGHGSAFYRNATNLNAGEIADARIPGGVTRDNEVMPIVLSADGSGSGLDADLLDGLHGADYAGVNHNHDSRYVNVTGDGMSGSTPGVVLNVDNTGSGTGIVGSTTSSTTGSGVAGSALATTGSSYGVYGASLSPNGGAGVYGESPYVGVWGQSTGRWGVYSYASGASQAYGVYGDVKPGTGNYAGYFSGNVRVTGVINPVLAVTQIDDPTAPKDRYLNHALIASPDMMNVYNGNVTLDANGAAWVDLPTYFEALNRDFRYQLTPIGGPGPNLFVAQEVQNNRFQIGGGSPGLRVSWQVTGIRQDPYANANRVVPEEQKPIAERGTYLNPEAYGVDATQGTDYKLSAPVRAASSADTAAGQP